MAGSGFSFVNMEPDSRLLTRSSLRLLEALTLGPCDAKATGTIERARDCYLATIRVRSQFLNHSLRAAGVTAASATERVLTRLENFLYDWRYAKEPTAVSAAQGPATKAQAA